MPHDKPGNKDQDREVEAQAYCKEHGKTTHQREHALL